MILASIGGILLTIVFGILAVLTVVCTFIVLLLLQLWNLVVLIVPHIVAAINWIISLI